MSDMLLLSIPVMELVFFDIPTTVVPPIPIVIKTIQRQIPIPLVEQAHLLASFLIFSSSIYSNLICDSLFPVF